jgi:O-antigen/teichoic acid export membrane protein
MGGPFGDRKDLSVSIRRHLAWMLWAQGSLFTLQFLSTVVLARLLTPYEMGVYALAAALTAVLATVQAFGLSTFIVREQDLHPELIVTVFTVNTVIAILLAAAIAGLSTFGGNFLREQGVKRVMLVLAFIPLLGIFEFLPSTKLQRAAEFKTLSLINTARAVLATVLTIGLAFARFSYMSIAYGQLGGYVLSALAYNVVGRRHVSLRIGLTEWRRITRFGAQMLAIGGVYTIGIRASEFLLGRLVGLGALGLYSRASSLNNLLWENIHLVIGRVVFVDLAAQKRQGASLRESYIRIVDIITALMWPAFTGLAIVSGPFIYNVYGARWVAAAHPLVMLCIASMVLVSITMTWELFVVSQETGRQARIEIVRTGAGLLLFIAGCLVNLTTAAAARIGEALFSVFLYRPHLNRMTETHTRDFLPIYRRSLLLTAVANLPAAAVMVAYRGSERAPLPYLLAAVAAGATGWLIALKVLDHPVAGEIMRLLRRLRREGPAIA